MIEEERLSLVLFWIGLMLIYILGDVLRIFAGDFKPGKIEGTELGQIGWLGIAVLMVIPILMIIIGIILPYPIVRWVHIVVSIFFFLFNAIGVMSYTGWYDRFLIVISLGVNLLIVWYAWRWQV